MLKRVHPTEEDIPLSEPLIIAEVFLDGFEIAAGPHAVRLAGWAKTATGRDVERRIAVRIALPLDAAQWFSVALGDALLGKDTPAHRREMTIAQFRDVSMDN